jgi:hypothetical protein
MWRGDNSSMLLYGVERAIERLSAAQKFHLLHVEITNLLVLLELDTNEFSSIKPWTSSTETCKLLRCSTLADKILRYFPVSSSKQCSLHVYVGVLISLWSSLFPIFIFATPPKEFFLDGLKKLQERRHKCVELRGEYVNTFFSPVPCCFLYKAKVLSAPLLFDGKQIT